MKNDTAKIAFGGGCHWCTEAVFQQLKGVIRVEQGFVASVNEYQSFSEAVIVHFNPSIIPLKILVEIHLYTHKSTSNHSMRSKYRSAIYYFTDEEKPDQSYGGGWDGRLYISHYHAGLWIVDIETLMLEAKNPNLNRTEVHSVSTIGYHLPHGQDGTPLSSSYYDFGWTPFIWAAEYHNGYVYLSCITTGLYIVQLDIDKPYHVG